MEASSIIQGEVQPVKLSQADPMVVVELPKLESNEEKIKLETFELPVITKNDSKIDKSEHVEEVSQIVEMTMQSVDNCKVKVTI